MGLVLPDVSVTTGPQYATLINGAMNTIDSHNHSSGSGVRITPSGLNIDAELGFNGQPATSLQRTAYSTQVSPLSGVSYARSVYFSGNELYATDGTGAAIQLTSGGAINVSSIGTIGGDYATSGASVLYSNSGSKSYSFLQGTPNTTRPANMLVGQVSIYDNSVTGGNYVKFSAIASLAASYDLTLFSALPGSTLPVQLDSSGQLSTGQITTAQVTALNITTALIADNAVTTAKILDANVTANKILDQNVTSTKIADLNVTTIKIADLNVTTAKIADLNVTTAKIAAGAVTYGKLQGPNIGFSGSSGNFISFSAAFVAVTGLSAAITTHGNPIRIKLISDNTAAASYLAAGGGATNNSMEVRIMRDATEIGRVLLGSSTSSSSSPQTFFPPGMIEQYDTVAAGVYTYSIETRYTSGAFASLVFCRMVVEEFNT
jgi:hypothetical protein